jgi:hypothetical protein
MKKLLLLSLALGLMASGYPQKRIAPSKSLKSIAIKKEVLSDLTAGEREMKSFPYKSTGFIPEETQVGDTWYDQQTNATNQNRIQLYDDGTIGVTWMIGYNPPGFTDRGTGYNYFDGNAWSEYPTTRIESQRTGWPSYIPLGESGEMVIAHISGGTDDGLLINERPEKGTGTWSETLFVGPSPGGESLVWPRATSTGVDNNTVHLLAVTRPVASGGTVYAGLDGALVYSRSTDGGQTWDIQNEIIEGLSSEFYTHFNGDSYDWVIPRGGTIAFVEGDPFNDCFLMKSNDGGTTWQKTMIWENPYPMWVNEVTDTFYCVDGSIDVELDMNGMAHVVFGINRAYSDGDGTFWFPFIDGVGYWNETMPAFSNTMDALNPYGDPGSELIENYNLIGWTQDVNGDGDITFIGTSLDNLGKYYVGLSSMPQLVMGDQNQLYVIFSSLTETYENGLQNYRHLWSRVSTDGGLSWGPFTDLSGDFIHLFDEFAFPSCADQTQENSIFLVCQIDNEPGMAVAGDEDPYGSNRMTIMEVFKDEITGLKETTLPIAAPEVFQNSPNPFSGMSRIRVDVHQRSILGLKVYNLVGQLVYERQACQVNSGTHFLNVDAGNFQPGVYFYTVFVNDKMITRKMVVE